jgi:nickel-dependent lactate racemase
MASGSEKRNLGLWLGEGFFGFSNYRFGFSAGSWILLPGLPGVESINL